MAANETRLLVLGAVSLFEPVNGYQIRRELMSWEVDRWAHINPGSIYSSLATLTRQGHLRRHDLTDGGREVAVYTSTDAGREELGSLFVRALGTVEVLDPLPLHTALSMCTLFPREVVAGCLATRVGALADHLAELRRRLAGLGAGGAPPHVARVLELRISLGEVELTWVEGFLAEVRSGALGFAGEPTGWQPPADDPGRQLAKDQVRYRALLGAGER
jgi:DNA-binding PadR family transcriptional regulator